MDASAPKLTDRPGPPTLPLDTLADLVVEQYPSAAGFAAAALHDLSDAAALLAPFPQSKRAVIFGSARIDADSIVYAAVRELAKMLADTGFLVITGGGPGVMTAGLEGAGPGNAAGISVDLPFESPAVVDTVPVITQRRFFTRKLAMVRSTQAVIVAPGGFGTLDELFEVCTLLQTGKKDPTPVVLFDPTGGAWSTPIMALVATLAGQRLIAGADAGLLDVAYTASDAFAAVSHFWSNYRGCRFDRGAVELRLATIAGLSPAALDAHFPDFAPHTVGVDTDGAWLRCTYDRRLFGMLRGLIDVCNAAAAPQ